MSKADNVLILMHDACKKAASKEIKEDLAAGKKAVKQLDALHKKFNVLERKYRDLQHKREIDLERKTDRLNRREDLIRLASSKLARSARAIIKLKDAPLGALFDDDANYWSEAHDEKRAVTAIMKEYKEGTDDIKTPKKAVRKKK